MVQKHDPSTPPGPPPPPSPLLLCLLPFQRTLFAVKYNSCTFVCPRLCRQNSHLWSTDEYFHCSIHKSTPDLCPCTDTILQALKNGLAYQFQICGLRKKLETDNTLHFTFKAKIKIFTCW